MSMSCFKSIITEAAIIGVIEPRTRISGHVLNPTGQKSPHKILSKKFIGKRIAQRYPRLSKLEMLKRRGKGPPKKEQGKRASKHK